MTENKVYVCALAVHWDRDLFPDNKLGKCADCGEMIVFRPNSPLDDSSIKKVCSDCVLKHIEEAKAKGEEIKSEVWDPVDILNAIKRMSGQTGKTETKQ